MLPTLGSMRSRLARRMALTAQDGAADLWVKRNVIVLSAVIANYVVTLGGLIAGDRLL